LFDRLASRAAVVPPTIFISAYDDPATLQRARASGARGWLRKPFSAAALLELIEPYFASRHSGSSNERGDVSAYSTAAVAARDC
jgi:CheY-like chemotaxis protein